MIHISRALALTLLLAAALCIAQPPRSGDQLAARALAADLNDNEGDVPEDVLDDVSLLLNWAGGGANGVIGKLCDVSAVSGTACEASPNEIMRVNVTSALAVRGWPSEPVPEFALRLGDGRERPPVDIAGDTVFWWIPLEAEPGDAVVLMQQGSSVAQFPVKIVRRAQPLVAAAWQRDGPDAPSEVAPAGRAGNQLAVRLAGFPANQEVALLLFRLVDSHALGLLALFDQPLASVRADDSGKATLVWDMSREQEPGSYSVQTLPISASNGNFTDQGAQLCIVPRSEPDLCGSVAMAIGPEALIKQLIARSITLAAQTWAGLARDAGRPASELECVYADTALAQRRNMLQSLRASGSTLDARLTLNPRVQTVVEAQPDTLRSGVVATVVERWSGKIVRSDGSEESIEPSRQTWRYLLRRGSSGTSSPQAAPCGSGLVIAEATLLFD